MATFVQIPGIVEGRTGYIYKDLKIDRDLVANYHEYVDIEVEGTLLTGRVKFYLDGVDGYFLANQTISQFEGVINPPGPVSSVVNVISAADLPSTLVANTTYVVSGQISISTAISVTNENTSIIGRDRDKDGLTYTGTGAFITVTDQDFHMENLRLSATNLSSSIMSASNISASGYNNSRLKFLTMFKCQVRDCYDILDINGFDLVDLNNTLFIYSKAQNFGLRFRDVSKLQITSCEIIRWFDESTIPSPSGWATVSMIELQANNIASFGAVNINGCIIHPQQTQVGIDIDPSSTTGFGTIAANTFVNTGLLPAGNVFIPAVFGVPNYSTTATYTYDIFTNQGLLNSISGVVMTLSGNTTTTSLTANTPAKINTGGGASSQASVRYTVATDGRATYDGTKQVYVSLHATLSYDKQGGGTDPYTFYFYKNGSLLAGSGTSIEASTSSGSISMIYGTLMEQNDYIEMYVENTASNDNMTVSDFQLVIRE